MIIANPIDFYNVDLPAEFKPKSNIPSLLLIPNYISNGVKAKF